MTAILLMSALLSVITTLGLYVFFSGPVVKVGKHRA